MLGRHHLSVPSGRLRSMHRATELCGRRLAAAMRDSKAQTTSYVRTCCRVAHRKLQALDFF
jgi:hypothetical protein